MAWQLTDRDLIYCDNHLLVVNKPNGIATMGGTGVEWSLADAAKEYLAVKFNKPGNVFLGIVSRLDTMVSGVIVFARTSKGAARLNESFSKRETTKKYVAVVEGNVRNDQGTLTDWLWHDDEARRVRVVAEELAKRRPTEIKKGILHYRTLIRSGDFSVVEIDLETGRKHQIRVQLAQAGFPILGDGKYGSSQNGGDFIFLHASLLEVDHPTQDCRYRFTAKFPREWSDEFGEVISAIKLTNNNSHAIV